MNSRRLISLIVLIIACLVTTIPALATLPVSPTADSGVTFTVVSDGGASIGAGSSDMIGLQPNQAVMVVAQYPLSSVGRQIIPSVPDGGRILGATKQLVVDSNGTIQFQFQAGVDPGMYQVSLRDGTQETAVNFWVFDSESPSNNPIVINQ